ncbi:hypothetical protein WJX75_003917 [Coccomyxa subellipsoidea]|uniref:Uncharacterized protein n=1 Tax=Coccomyxa subellipsoidea TaxID=248742 RepID=A0ABR2YCZ7_9CHLO
MAACRTCPDRMGINTRSATACALSLALLSLSAASGIGRTTGEASKAMTRRLLSGCLSYQSSFTNNCGNTHHACDINAECCCDGDTYTSLSGCNYCCNPGFVGCHVPTYDDYYQQTMDYGCYETACPAGSTQHVTTPNSSSGNSGGTQYGNGAFQASIIDWSLQACDLMDGCLRRAAID